MKKNSNRERKNMADGTGSDDRGATYPVHVDAVGVGPRVLIGLDEAVGERLGDVVEVDELLDGGLHLVVLLRALVESQHDRGDVPEDGGRHQGCDEERDGGRRVTASSSGPEGQEPRSQGLVDPR